MLMNWRHSGFNVFCGPRLQPGDEKAMENLARYIIRASFSQERMTYPKMSPTGNCFDNAITESFFATLKKEHVFYERYETRYEAQKSIFKYI